MSFIKSAMSHFQVRKCNLRVQNPVEFSFPLPKQPAMFQIWATSSAWIWEWRCPGAASPGHSQHCSGCLCNTRWEANFCGFQWLTEQDLGEPSRKQFHKVVRKKNLSCEVPRSDRMGKSDIQQDHCVSKSGHEKMERIQQPERLTEKRTRLWDLLLVVVLVQGSSPKEERIWMGKRLTE